MTRALERVARGLARLENRRQIETGFAFEIDFPDSDLEFDWEQFVPDARAAIEAMRDHFEAEGRPSVAVEINAALEEE